MVRLFLVLVSVCGLAASTRPEHPASSNDSTDGGGGKAGGGLRKGLQPGEVEAVHAGEKRHHAKRQFYLPPPFQQQPFQQQPYQQQSFQQQPFQQQSFQQQPFQQQPFQQHAQQSQFPFVPIYIPYRQVVEVHHVVMLQQPPVCTPQQQPQGPSPGTRPGQPDTPGIFPYPPVTSAPPTVVTPTTDSGLDTRMGSMDRQNNSTMPRRPSRCVWAIVACCSPDSTSIRYSCFELLGCPGAFWGVNPCEPKVVQAAANTALNFYMSGGTDEGDLSQNSV